MNLVISLTPNPVKPRDSVLVPMSTGVVSWSLCDSDFVTPYLFSSLTYSAMAIEQRVIDAGGLGIGTAKVE